MRALLAFAAAAAAMLIAASPAAAAVGDLSYKGCISGETESNDACELVAGSTAGGTLSGLNSLESVTVAPSGRRVYGVARQDDSIAVFKRKRSGALKYRGCITGDTNVSACDQTPTATAGGASSGLDDVRALAIAPDGDFAYAVSANDDAVTRFELGGAAPILFDDCVSGDQSTGPLGTDACEITPDASIGGAHTGLDHPKSLTISRDGKSLFAAASEDAAIAQFQLRPRTGAISYESCISGETESGPLGSAACTMTGTQGSLGNDSGLDDPRGLAMTRKDKQLVGVSSDDDALFVFDWNSGTRTLAFDSCFTGESETVANADCDASFPTAGGSDSGFDDLRSLALGGGGTDIYVVSRFDASVVHFDVDSGLDCLSADTGAAGQDPCDSMATPAPGGQNTGLEAPESAVLSRDGRTLYVSTAQDAGVATFNRNRDTGVLTYDSCLSGDVGLLPCFVIPAATLGGGNSGLSFPQFIALSPDDKSLYVAASDDDAVARFKRAR